VTRPSTSWFVWQFFFFWFYDLGFVIIWSTCLLNGQYPWCRTSQPSEMRGLHLQIQAEANLCTAHP
jgi:hypothetical protein